MSWKTSLVILPLLIVLATLPSTGGDSKDRSRVKDFAFEFSPSQTAAEGVPPLQYCLLTPINSNRVDRHTKNLEKAFRNMDPSEYPRVLGFRFNANGKPLNRFLTADPFETILAEALREELSALGMTEAAVPIEGPPENLRESTLREIAEAFPPGSAPDILIATEIEDFYFETVPGPFKIKMETSFMLEVAVFDVEGKELLWEGEVEVGHFEKKGMAMGRTAVDKRLNEHFAEFIEGVVRNNEELKAALADQAVARR